MALRRVTRPAARRKMVWAREAVDANLIPATGSVFDLLSEFRVLNGGAQPLGSTVTRIRFDLTMTAVLASSGATLTEAAQCGIIVDQTTVVGTEVPRPVADAHADWMWWRRLSIVAPGAAMGPVLTAVATYELDAQSQRKMEELGETLWFVIEPALGASAGILNVRGTFSTLLKLP